MVYKVFDKKASTLSAWSETLATRTKRNKFVGSGMKNVKQRIR